MLTIKKFDFLVSVYIFCIAVAELMGGKTFPLANIFGYQLNASVAILVLPLIFTINDVITEVYGKKRAKSVVRSGLLFLLPPCLLQYDLKHLKRRMIKYSDYRQELQLPALLLLLSQNS